MRSANSSEEGGFFLIRATSGFIWTSLNHLDKSLIDPHVKKLLQGCFPESLEK